MSLAQKRRTKEDDEWKRNGADKNDWMGYKYSICFYKRKRIFLVTVYHFMAIWMDVKLLCESPPFVAASSVAK